MGFVLLIKAEDFFGNTNLQNDSKYMSCQTDSSFDAWADAARGADPKHIEFLVVVDNFDPEYLTNGASNPFPVWQLLKETGHWGANLAGASFSFYYDSDWSINPPLITTVPGEEGENGLSSNVARDIFDAILHNAINGGLDWIGSKMIEAGVATRSLPVIAAGAMVQFAPEVLDFVSNVLLPFLSFDLGLTDQEGIPPRELSRDIVFGNGPGSQRIKIEWPGADEIEIIDDKIWEVEQWCISVRKALGPSNLPTPRQVEQAQAIYNFMNTTFKFLAKKLEPDIEELFDAFVPGPDPAISLFEDADLQELLEAACQQVQDKYKNERERIIIERLNINLDKYFMDPESGGAEGSITDTIGSAPSGALTVADLRSVFNDYFRDRLLDDLDIQSDQKKPNLAEVSKYVTLDNQMGGVFYDD